MKIKKSYLFIISTTVLLLAFIISCAAKKTSIDSSNTRNLENSESVQVLYEENGLVDKHREYSNNTVIISLQEGTTDKNIADLAKKFNMEILYREPLKTSVFRGNFENAML